MSRRKVPVTFNFGQPLDTRNEQIQTKGGSLVFDETKIRGWLRVLLPYSDVQVSDLTGDQLKAFNNLRSYINILYETEVHYERLYKIVQEIFSPVTVVVAGTVGGYFRGCFLQSGSTGQRGCEVTCVKSMPPPRSDRSYQPCEYGVIRTVYDTRSKQYVFIKDKENKEGLYYLYLEAGYYLNEDQKNLLKKMGVSKVWIKGPGDVDYSHGFVELSAVPTNQETPSSDGEAMMIFIFLFFIIILLCLSR